MSVLTNMRTVQDLDSLNLSEIGSIPIEELKMLYEQIEEDRLRTATRKKKIVSALSEKVGGVKEPGAIEGQGFVVKATKKVVWDEAKLSEIRDKIAASGDNPDEYIQTKLSVSERSYGAWPGFLKERFKDARSVGLGTVSVSFQ